MKEEAPQLPPDPNLYLFRCALIGSEGVGKSSLIERYLHGTFNENGGTPTATAVVEREKNNIKVENKNILLKIYDFPSGLENTSGGITSKAFVFLVYDVTKKSSFENIEDQIENFNNLNKNPKKLLYIVANKTDIGGREVTEEMGRQVAQTYGC